MKFWQKIVAGPLAFKEERLKAQRKGENMETFFASFSNTQVDERLLREVYQYFQGATLSKDFPVRYTDNIDKVYGICDDDLDDAILDLANLCGYRTPTTEEVKHLKPIRTIEDLVKLLAMFRADSDQ